MWPVREASTTVTPTATPPALTSTAWDVISRWAIAERNEALEKEVARLTKEPAAVEKIAREDLSLVAPGDVVLVLPPGFEEKVTPKRTPVPSPAASGR